MSPKPIIQSSGIRGSILTKVVVFLVLFILISVVATKILLDGLFREYDLEQFDLTYKEYLRKSNENRIKIPESSKYIDIFAFRMRDYWCNAIQAEIYDGVPDLHAIVADYDLYGFDYPMIVENVADPASTLSRVFGHSKEVPAWLIWDDPMFESNTNILKYGQGTYSRGIWAFFNEPTHTLWVFAWSAQHLSIGPFGEEE